MTGKPKREKRLEVRFNELEYKALRDYADRRGMSMAECIRDWIKTLIKDD